MTSSVIMADSVKYCRRERCGGQLKPHCHLNSVFQFKCNCLQCTFVAVVSQRCWLSPFTDKNAFSELIPSAIPDINTSQSLALSTENLIEDEPQLITKTTGNSFISFLILSYGLKQFVYDVQDGQQTNHGNKHVIQTTTVFRQRRRFTDGIHRQQAQQ